MEKLKLGSLFTGIGGLDIAVCEVFNAELCWVSEIDPNANKVLAAHYPDVPNLGDVTQIDFSTVEHVDQRKPWEASGHQGTVGKSACQPSQ